MEVDFAGLKDACKTLNDECGTAIKYVGVKKDEIIKSFAVAVSSLDDIPETVKVFYEANLADMPTIEVSADDPAPEEEQTPTQDAAPEATEDLSDLVAHVDAINKTVEENGWDFPEIVVPDDVTREQLTKIVSEGIDRFDDAQWDKLPLETRNFDNAITEDKGGEKTTGKKGKAKDKDTAPKADKKATAKRDPLAPRPGWTYTPGTSSYFIIEVMKRMVKDSDVKGVTPNALYDECMKEKPPIRSNNLKARVNTALRYAATPQGGEQVVKVDTLWYFKGDEPKA